MVFLEEAGLLETVREHVEQYAFQFKMVRLFTWQTA